MFAKALGRGHALAEGPFNDLKGVRLDCIWQVERGEGWGPTFMFAGQGGLMWGVESTWPGSLRIGSTGMRRKETVPC